MDALKQLRISDSERLTPTIDSSFRSSPDREKVFFDVPASSPIPNTRTSSSTGRANVGDQYLFGSLSSATVQPRSRIPGANDVSRTEEEDIDWNYVNQLLVKEGFEKIPLSEDFQLNESTDVPRFFEVSGKFIRRTFVSVLRQLQRRAKLVQDLLVNIEDLKKKQLNVSRQTIDEELHHEALRQELVEKNEMYQEQLDEKDFEFEQLSEQHEQLKAKFDELETKYKSQESSIVNMKAQLDAWVQKESVRQQRVQTALHSVKDQIFDARIQEVVESYEIKLEDLQREADICRKEVEQMTKIVKDVQGGSTTVIIDTFEEMSRTKRELGEKDATLRRWKFDEQRTPKLELEVESLTATNIHLQKEIRELKEQLEKRPTQADWRAAQMKISDLEYHLEETQMNFVVGWQPRKRDALPRHESNTVEQIRRDKAGYRAYMLLKDLPGEQAKEILMEVMQVLELTDVKKVLPYIRQMSRVMISVPSMQKILAEVDEIVFGHVPRNRPARHAHTADGVVLQGNIQDIPSGLRAWKDQLVDLRILQNFKTSVVRELSTGSSQDMGPRVLSTDQVVDRIRTLVALEGDLMLNRKVALSADISLSSDPEVLLHKIVLHFQKLFDVKSVEGVFPKMNEVFLLLNESRNGIKILRETLGLEATSSFSACNTAVAELMKQVDYHAIQSNPRGQRAPSQLGLSSTYARDQLSSIHHQKDPKIELSAIDIVAELQVLFEATDPVQLVSKCEAFLERHNQLEKVFTKLDDIIVELCAMFNISKLREIIPCIRELRNSANRVCQIVFGRKAESIVDLSRVDARLRDLCQKTGFQSVLHLAAELQPGKKDQYATQITDMNPSEDPQEQEVNS
eukprot:TRINITY_DN4699_c0_g1_i12.p1 TRINITY_DN4699_c0_g1~~TRINITY_DN4699_c0_g1_i12.p1  ORF type:complete len:854 (+),score=193.52 TRINITY_DN4699_c0_g1_i12:47-2608(+)